jgi:hypothetical protein
MAEAWFQKVAAFIFLLLLVGMICFLTFIPLPPASEKAVLMIVGGLMALSTQSLPKLFGSSKEQALHDEIGALKIKHEELRKSYDMLVTLLVERHVIEQQGIVSD